MKKQVILKFLNLPGIVGLGLIDDHSYPYFSGIDQSLNFQQKEALAQGIQQVIGTTPAEFESFDFRFAQQSVHIYKLSNGVILLVATDQQLERSHYDDAVLQLRETLELDSSNAISTFRLLVDSGTLNRSQAPVEEEPPSENPSEPTPVVVPEVSVSDSVVDTDYLWQECLDALNVLTDATAQYLGKIVVANTWRNTCSDPVALNDLQIDRSGHFSLKANATIKSRNPMNADDCQIIYRWVSQFVQRCSTIIRDYPEMVLRQGLTDQQRAVLQIEISE